MQQFRENGSGAAAGVGVASHIVAGDSEAQTPQHESSTLNRGIGRLIGLLAPGSCFIQ